MIDKTVSHYKVLGKLGEDGQGAVYRARDLRLERDVALKFLHESIAAEPEFMDRFRREAKVLAALNHSGVAGIYDIDKSDSGHFLTLEYIDGESLAAMIKRGALPRDRTLDPEPHAPVGGGSPVEFASMNALGNLRCGLLPDSRCVVTRTEGDIGTFSEIDPMTGQENVLVEVSLEEEGLDPLFSWCLSPEGRRVAWSISDDNNKNHQVVIRDLEGAAKNVIALPDSVAIGAITWDTAGNGLLTVAFPRRVLIRIHEDGALEEFTVTGEDEFRTGGVLPSLDGKRIAFHTAESERNFWLVRGY